MINKLKLEMWENNRKSYHKDIVYLLKKNVYNKADIADIIDIIDRYAFAYSKCRELKIKLEPGKYD